MCWINVRDNLPTTEPGKQVDVYFCCPHWATGQRGMFTYWGNGVSDVEYEWSVYNQEEDRFYLWEYGDPEYYVVLPEPSDVG